MTSPTKTCDFSGGWKFRPTDQRNTLQGLLWNKTRNRGRGGIIFPRWKKDELCTVTVTHQCPFKPRGDVTDSDRLGERMAKRRRRREEEERMYPPEWTMPRTMSPVLLRSRHRSATWSALVPERWPAGCRRRPGGAAAGSPGARRRCSACRRWWSRPNGALVSGHRIRSPRATVGS